MRIIKDTSWILLTVGIAVAALSVGLLIEFGRADEVRSQALVEVCVLSLMSYFTPTLWLRRRYGSDFGCALLIVPIVGTILVLLIVVHIPNAISIWKLSHGATSIVDAMGAVRMQLFSFFFGFLLFSATSALIIGLVQAISLGLLALVRFLSKALVNQISLSKNSAELQDEKWKSAELRSNSPSDSGPGNSAPAVLQN